MVCLALTSLPRGFAGFSDVRITSTYPFPRRLPDRALDGLGAHRPQRIRELIEARGADLVFLPSYSPDLNPIEIRQPQCAFRHKLSYHWPRRAARATGAGREARSRPYIRRRGGSAM